MTSPRVPQEVRELAAEMAEPKPMRRGSVSERWMKCGQKSCRCHEDANARHGPYYSLTRVEGGKTRSRYLTGEQAELARQQVKRGQEFRRKMEAYWEACERWADAELEGGEVVSDEETEKKRGSKGP